MLTSVAKDMDMFQFHFTEKVSYKWREIGVDCWCHTLSARQCFHRDTNSCNARIFLPKIDVGLGKAIIQQIRFRRLSAIVIDSIKSVSQISGQSQGRANDVGGFVYKRIGRIKYHEQNAHTIEIKMEIHGSWLSL